MQRRNGILMTRKLPAALVALFLLTGCTFVRYSDGALMVIDIHPGGESIALDGVLNERGALSVNREQGSSAEIVSDVVDAAVGL
jgi:hypothetical protein